MSADVEAELRRLRGMIVDLEEQLQTTIGLLDARVRGLEDQAAPRETAWWEAA